ncbi:hypothetical protein FXN61_39710, partial [Lentzea sp. PSKA42]|nr:hypothetical protein [Lentzea indica]
MTGRGASTDDEQNDHGRGSGRLLLVAALTLALGAAAVLVASDSARMLRLAVVAALWAALVGAFLAAKYRKQVTERDDEVADLQSVYELELEREVAARREYELEIESETRKRIEEESRADIEALRADLHALRDNLQALLGGDVLVERVALRAESTRLRSLASDASRLTAGPEKRIINAKPVISTSSSVEKPSERTELIERVAHDAKVQPPRREPARPEPTRPEPTRNSPRPQPAVVRREPVKAAKQEPIRQQPRPAAASVSARLGAATPPPPGAQKVPPPTVKAPPVQAQVQRTERVPRPQQNRTDALSRPEQPPKAPTAVAKAVETRKPEPRSRVAERTEMIDPKVLESRTQATGGGRRRADDRPAPAQDSGSWETLKPDSPSSSGGRRRADDPPARRSASEDSLVSLPPAGRRAPDQSSARLPVVSTGRRSAADDVPVSGRRVAE